ncbi:MAG: hypothetical protein N7Q72_04320, partial [Spiroplasma sp. Tabriz.8]|nr:hypothetical protein [Spiroplasma sp. Tabriz.8]
GIKYFELVLTMQRLVAFEDRANALALGLIIIIYSLSLSLSLSLFARCLCSLAFFALFGAN